MRGYLSKETRLGISITRLKTSVAKLRLQVQELTLKLKEKDARIAQLEARLQDKEGQRKELLSYLSYNLGNRVLSVAYYDQKVIFTGHFYLSGNPGSPR